MDLRLSFLQKRQTSGQNLVLLQESEYNGDRKKRTLFPWEAFFMKKLRILSLWILVAVSMCLWVSAADYTWTAEDESYTLTFQENSDGTLTLSG